MSFAPWATTADVASVTGKTVDGVTRNIAVASLETMIGLIEVVDRPDISDRDRHYLKLATCYQAAFVADNPDLFSRNDVTSASQDGESANYRNVDAHLLAPLARKAIRRLSWKAKTRSGDRAAASATVADLIEARDDAHPWRRL